MENRPEIELKQSGPEGGDTGAGRRFPRLKRWELALTVLGATLFAGSAYLYLSNTSLRELLWGEEFEAGQKIGKVGEIRGSLKREFADSMSFKPVSRSSEVFNRDTVMTDASSTALIELDDGSIIELGPSTMIKLIAGSRSVFGGVSFPKVQMVSGNLKVRATAGEIRVRSRAQEVRVEKQMARQVSVSADAPVINPADTRLVRVSEAVPLERAAELKLPPPASPKPAVPAVVETPARMVIPSPSPVVATPSPSPSPVPVRTATPPKPSPTPKALPSPKPKPKPLPPPKPKPSPTPIVHIPIPTEPSNDQQFSIKVLQVKGTGILLTWHKAQGAEGYMVEITRDDKMSDFVVKADLTNNFYVYKATVPGRYWWRVRSTRGENGEFDSRPSGIFRFVVVP